MTHSGLPELFEAALSDTSRLLATLEEEFKALSRPDAAMIEESVARKRSLITNLEDESVRRAAILQAAGYMEGTTNMQTWLNGIDDTPDRRLSRLWQDFTFMLRKCQKQNQINGRVIDVNRHRVHDALCILRGTELDSGLYDPRGSTQTPVASRPITMA